VSQPQPDAVDDAVAGLTFDATGLLPAVVQDETDGTVLMVAWMDAEMTVKEGANKALIRPYLEKAEVAENIAANFIAFGRPLFNEQAYKVLVDQGQGDRADRYHYNDAEEILGQSVLKGPGSSTAASIQLFNEIFGA